MRRRLAPLGRGPRASHGPASARRAAARRPRDALDARGLGAGARAGGHTRFGLLAGELIRLPVRFLADEGEPAEVEATWFLSPEWPGPIVIGWKGCLERMRFAFDPYSAQPYWILGDSVKGVLDTTTKLAW